MKPKLIFHAPDARTLCEEAHGFNMDEMPAETYDALEEAINGLFAGEVRE